MTLNDIISDITSSKHDIASVLRQAKVIAFKINNTDLQKWIDYELNWYPESVSLPDYRIITHGIQWVISNGVYQYSNQVLTVSHLEERLKTYLTTAQFREWIVEINEQANSCDKFMYWMIDPVCYSELSKAISTEGWYSVQWAKRVISTSSIKGILDQISNKLLSFLLELSNIIDPELEIVKLQRPNALLNNQITNMTQQIFNGSVTISWVSWSVALHWNNNYTQSNGLPVEELKKLWISQVDIDKLPEIAKIEDIAEKEIAKNSWIETLKNKWVEIAASAILAVIAHI